MKKQNPRITKKQALKQPRLSIPTELGVTETSDVTSELNREIHALKTQLNEARMKYRHVTQSHAVIKEQLTASKAAVDEAHLAKQQAILMESELRQLRKQLDIAQARLKAEAVSLSDLKRNNLKGRIALGEKELEFAEKERLLLLEKERVLRVRNHLSYRLGNALIQSTKSWKGVMSLPKTLLKLSSEAKQRRDRLELKQADAQTLLSAPANKDLAELKRQLHQLPALNDASKLKSLKIACVMDTFTYQSYAPEACLLQLSPDNWQAELDAFKPDMLFIESAWRGKDDLWGNKVGHTSQELFWIVNWCKQNKVPTLFWNKEDPIHFETFLNTAKLFDHIFTTDIDCIARYKKALGHNQVYFLPFAAQPKVNNPVEKYKRKDKFCFAGAYYVKYPDRIRDLNNFVVSLPEYRDIDIYDRNFGKNDPNYMFPEEYQPYIVGTLPYDQIDKAYKGYNYAINLNSIKQSQSMFARRVFELLASNTVTVSNFSHGLRLMFGDLVCTSDSGEEIVSRLEQLTGNELKLKQFRLQALRKVMTEHTYQDRLNYIHSKLSGSGVLPVLPQIKVFAYVKNTAALETIVRAFERQAYAHKSLTLVLSGVAVCDEWRALHDTIELLTPNEAEELDVLQWLNKQWLACMVAEDYYGEYYLTDLALATRYTDKLIIGKKACLRWRQALVKSFSNAEYKEAIGLTPRQSLMSPLALPEVSLRKWLTTLYTWQSDETQFAIDSLNYCMDGAGHCEAMPEFLQPEAINTGLSLMDMQTMAEAMVPASVDISTLPSIHPDELAQLFKPGRDSLCVAALADGKLQIASNLPDGKHEYWYSTRDFTLSELGANGSKLNLHLEVTPGLNLQVVLLFLDKEKQRISHTIFTANKNTEIGIPAGTSLIRPGLRVYASGYCDVSNLYLSKTPSYITKIVTDSSHLVLTNNYPSYKDLYKNGFVHSRVMAYHEQGVGCDIFRFNSNESLKFDEYKNINKISGGKEQLKILLESHEYKSILVHFLNSEMWSVLTDYVSKTKIVVWVHGAEIHPWYRRKYNLNSTQDLTKIKSESEKRMEFWRKLLRQRNDNLKLIFVSDSFKNEVFEDLGFSLDNSQYKIIHNPINTELFDYSPKNVEHRKRILSIRPFASRQYANDLSVKVIVELSKHQIFDDLSFTIVGDGPLFEETIEPVKNFHNVTIHKKFVSHHEISLLHKEHGLFLCPTRWDSQGVSRDEAMSSGLVPLTTNIAAIPEFVDDSCAILAEPEDVTGIVDGIINLYHNQDLFIKMSYAASCRVKRTICNNVIIIKELIEIT